MLKKFIVLSGFSKPARNNSVIINFITVKTKTMEKFVFLFRGGHYAELSPEETQVHMQKWFKWVETLSKDGVYAGGDPLQPGGKQVTGKNKVVTDGPYIEAKEMVGGYFIVNAESLDEATEISKDCPIFEVDGRLEVRQIRKR